MTWTVLVEAAILLSAWLCVYPIPLNFPESAAATRARIIARMSPCSTSIHPLDSRAVASGMVGCDAMRERERATNREVVKKEEGGLAPGSITRYPTAFLSRRLSASVPRGQTNSFYWQYSSRWTISVRKPNSFGR
ncbi:hypothetical protein B0H66DRAFT_297018 [Apodospora peruviana]|uniref:Secreted protein n=1 Tax=Apodospora peruviana TaxID=516989 RepID=A0AAE0M2D6_9PEZI|nr:hypothetical protein B0H66DRAFT_297018 [Apodospora peruviana]